jgi:hypothetical protein
VDPPPPPPPPDVVIVLGRDAPLIDQHSPAGETEDSPAHKLEDWNCGPTTIAMVAYSKPDVMLKDSTGQMRKVAEMTQDQLISELDVIAGTSEKGGTSFKGMRSASAAIGMAVDKTEAWWSNEGEGKKYDPTWIDNALKADKLVVVNGAIDEDGGGPLPKFDHYMLIVGKNQAGEFIINDPWDGKRKVMNADVLHQYFVDNTLHDGLAIVVG